MSADRLLSHLDRVKQTKPGQWIARCPAHDDKGPSLSVRETDEGKVLLFCFAGCTAHQVVSAVGLELDDLFPERHQHHATGERRPFSAVDALRCLAFEASVVFLGAKDVAAGKVLTDADRERLLLAAERINAARGACRV